MVIPICDRSNKDKNNIQHKDNKIRIIGELAD